MTSETSFFLRSSGFVDGDYLATKYIMSADLGFGCAGGNVSPALEWGGAPDGTRSFALSLFDPDAPTGSGFWHWVVVNIPPTLSALPAGAGSETGLPSGALQTRTDVGIHGYGGPCPPKGDHPHRYIFTLTAVDLDALPVNADTSAALVGFQVNFHTLAKATLMGLYKW
jgi:Raf kinase inhibitor-like YbhB/YbcL family protein